MRSSYSSRILMMSCLLAAGCADVDDALENDDAPVLAQVLDGGGPVSTRADAGFGARDAGTIDASSGGSAAGDAGAGGASDGIDMTGTWFAKVTSKADITAPLVGTAASDVNLSLRLYVSKGDGEGWKADVAVCSMETKSGSLALDFKKLQAFIKLSEEIPSFTAAVGGKVPLPDMVFHIGQDAAGKATDMDGDGKPGATIPSTALGAVPFDAYVGMDLKIELVATLKDKDTVAGTSTFSGAGSVLGSTIPLVSSGVVAVKQTQIPTSFEAKRRAGDVSCADLLK